MNLFSLGQKNLHFPFSCLITSFLFGCSFENIFLFHLYSLQKSLSSNKYLRAFIELITDWFREERKIIVHELTNVAGTTLNNHAWIISSTNVITEQFRKCEKASIFCSYFLSWLVFWMAFKHPWLNVAGNLLVEPIPNKKCPFIKMKRCWVWEPVVCFSTHGLQTLPAVHVAGGKLPDFLLSHLPPLWQPTGQTARRGP